MLEDEQRFWDASAIAAVTALSDARWKDTGAAYSSEHVASRAADIAHHLLAQRRAYIAKQGGQ